MTLYVDINAKQVYSSLFSSQPYPFAPWVQGSNQFIEVVPVTAIVGNTVNSQVWQPVSNGTGWSIIVALGNGFVAPLAGTWILQSGVALTSGTLSVGKWYTIVNFVAGDVFTNIGGTDVSGNVFQATGTTPTTWTNGSQLQECTAAMPYNATATQIATALNATAFATAAGGVLVTLTLSTFIVTFITPGAVTTMVGNGTGLAPLSVVDVSAIIPGSATTDTQAVQTIQLLQNPGAYQLLGNASSAAAITATRTQVGGGGFNETWTLVVDSRSYAGVFNILFENTASVIQETTTLAYNISDSNMQAALQALTNIGANNCTVNQVAPWTYVIQFVGALANTNINPNAISGAASGLLVPLGRYDTLGLSSAALELLLNGALSTSIKFEIRGTAPGGSQQYLFQGTTTLIASIIPPYATTPAPFSNQAALLALLLSLPSLANATGPNQLCLNNGVPTISS